MLLYWRHNTAFSRFIFKVHKLFVRLTIFISTKLSMFNRSEWTILCPVRQNKSAQPWTGARSAGTFISRHASRKVRFENHNPNPDFAGDKALRQGEYHGIVCLLTTKKFSQMWEPRQQSRVDSQKWTLARTVAFYFWVPATQGSDIQEGSKSQESQLQSGRRNWGSTKAGRVPIFLRQVLTTRKFQGS